MTDKFKLSTNWQDEVRVTLSGVYPTEDNSATALSDASDTNGTELNYKNLLQIS